MNIMRDIKEILQITDRNRAVIFRCQLQATAPYDVAYYNGKMDALDHIYSLLKEGEKNV
jgi:hypothetical protein